MEFKGHIERYWREFGKTTIMLGASNVNMEELENYKADEELRIEVVKRRAKRSVDANGLLWHCLGQIAKALSTDKWQVYLQMLKRYGKYTYIAVKPAAVDAIKKQWRECEEVGRININGEEAVQLLCYYGSSTYNVTEFSQLLEGVISELAEMGLEQPLRDDIRAALEGIKQHEKHNTGG